MKIRTGIFSAAAIVMALAGCGGDAKDEEPKGAIPQHMLDGMDKAENVENVLNQSAQERAEQTEGQ